MSASVSRRDFLALTSIGAVVSPWFALGVSPEHRRHATSIENSRVGSADWRLANVARRHEIEGYASRASVRPGERLGLHVRSETSECTLEVFRLGWYGGLGGRQVLPPVRLRNGREPTVPSPGAAGLVRCAWPQSYSLDIPDEWVSGVYFAKLTGAQDKQSGIIFVVREAIPNAPILCQLPITTYQAYNNWGGKSLYDFQSPGGRAHRVSFDRPYSPDALIGDRGFFYCDFQLVRWLEAQGYAVAYCTNLDIHTEADLARSHPVYLSCGHDEYWSIEMMDHVERAQAAGSHLLFLSADTCHWVVRMEEENRVETCYKRADLDPASPITVRFRDPEIKRPEVELMGVQNELHCITTTSIGYARDGRPSRYRVRNVDHHLFRHTGLQPGDGFEAIVGFEWDSVYPGSPQVTVLLECGDIQATCKYEDATDRVLPAQAVAFEKSLAGGKTSKVFSSGTIRWSWGLDDWQFDGQVARSRVSQQLRQMTTNILTWMDCVPATPDSRIVIDRTSQQQIVESIR